MKKLAVIAAAVSIVVLAVLAYGQMDDRGMGPGMMGDCGMMMGSEPHMMEHLMDLNLDEQQRTSIDEIKSRMMKDNIRRMADMRIAQIELRDLLRQDPVDMKAVEAKVKQLEMMRTEMRLSHIKAMEDIKTKLTPEQQKEFRDMLEAGPMMEGMGMMHQHRRGMTEE
jgi:Spy/CpxP family protein refolding chaperone